MSSQTSRRLNVASKNGDFESVIHLVQQHRADINANDGEALGLAAGSGHTDIVKFLINEGAEPSLKALGLASRGGHTNVVGVLERRIEERRIESCIKENKKRRIEERRTERRRTKKRHTERRRIEERHTKKRRTERRIEERRIKEFCTKKNKKPRMAYKQESLGDIDMRPTAQMGAFLGPKFLDRGSLGGCVFVV